MFVFVVETNTSLPNLDNSSHAYRLEKMGPPYMTAGKKDGMITLILMTVFFLSRWNE